MNWVSQPERSRPARRCTVAPRPLLFCTFCDIMLVDQVQQGTLVSGKGGWPCILAFEWKKKALSRQTGCGERAHPLAAPWTLSKDSGAPCLPTQPLQIAVVLSRHCADLWMRVTSALRHDDEALLFSDLTTRGHGWTSRFLPNKCLSFLICNIKMTEPCRLLHYKSSWWSKSEFHSILPPWGSLLKFCKNCQSWK